MAIKYSLSYRKINIAKLDEEGNKQYTTDGTLITEPAYKAYASCQSDSYGDTIAFAQAVARKNQFMGRSDILAVLTNIASVLKENILAGMVTKVGEMGSYKPTVSSNGCPEEEVDKFTAGKYIKKAYANWTRPVKLADMKSICEFEQVAPRNVSKAMLVGSKSQAITVTLPQSTANKKAAESGQIGGFRFDVFANDKTMGTILQTQAHGFKEAGTLFNVTVTPETGYYVPSITYEDGSEVPSSVAVMDGPNLKITMPNAPLKIWVNFEEE